MPTQTPRNSQLYRSFKAIEADSYRSILRFVENHTDELHLLTAREYFDLQYAYVAALYETGAYEQVVAQTTRLLELAIEHSVTEVDGEDAYRALLFRRAHGLFHLMRYDECIRVCDQTLRLYPEDRAVAHLYERALYQRPNVWVSRARATSVSLFLAAALLIAAEVIVVQHFLEEWAADVTLARNVCFVAGWLLLLGGDIAHRAWAWTRVANARRSYRARRAANMR